VAANESLQEGAEGTIPLGTFATVFQAEAMAIFGVADFLKSVAPEGSSICIFVDSMCILMALAGQGTTSELVGNVHSVLNELGISRSLTLEWIPAHSTHEENIRADWLAKQAAVMMPVGPQPLVPVSMTYVKTSIGEWAKRAHCTAWKQNIQCRQTKI